MIQEHQGILVFEGETAAERDRRQRRGLGLMPSIFCHGHFISAAETSDVLEVELSNIYDFGDPETTKVKAATPLVSIMNLEERAKEV